jgi:hypothetical protein
VLEATHPAVAGGQLKHSNKRIRCMSAKPGAGGPLGAQVADWRQFLAQEEAAPMLARLRRHGRTGRPLADVAFVTGLERRLGRSLGQKNPGRKPRRVRR